MAMVFLSVSTIATWPGVGLWGTATFQEEDTLVVLRARNGKILSKIGESSIL